MTIADLLTQSRQAHKAGQLAKAQGRAFVPLFTRAADLRLDASRQDPDFLDPAWMEDLKSAHGHEHRAGVMPLLERLRHIHKALIDYFTSQITPVPEPVQVSLKPEEIARKVVPAKDQALEDSHAYQQLLREQEVQ